MINQLKFLAFFIIAGMACSGCTDPKKESLIKSDSKAKIEELKLTKKDSTAFQIQDTTEQQKDSLTIVEDESSSQEEEIIEKPKKIKKKQYSKIHFEVVDFDFGEITEGDTIDYKFKFTNLGKAELEVLSAKATCGCTQPSFPFIGIPYKGEGVIGVKYISVGKSGKQEASITVKTNGANSPVVLKIFGYVKDKPTQKGFENERIDTSETNK
ncbi:MAG: DUF1573 domain-containing protein [Saprospiraceae bacterium]|nr:DUF1573 domain-containing protein [Saprospiraceae bacterium]